MSYDAPLDVKEAKATKFIMTENSALSERDALKLKPAKIRYVEQHGFQNLQESIRKRVGLYCLSEKRDDILMWSHYAGCHRGVCIEFSATKEDHVDFFSHAHRVTYEELLPHINLYRNSSEEIIKAAILTKSRQWSYEREWRVIDLERRPGHQPIPSRLISSVILGARATEETQTLIRELLRSLAWRVQLFCARISSDDYELEIVPN